jgi:anoctamin-10
MKDEFSEGDIYGTVEEYLEMAIQFSMVSLFGMTFPFSFIIAFIWNVGEIRTDKYKLTDYTQRP